MGDGTGGHRFKNHQLGTTLKERALFAGMYECSDSLCNSAPPTWESEFRLEGSPKRVQILQSRAPKCFFVAFCRPLCLPPLTTLCLALHARPPPLDPSILRMCAVKDQATGPSLAALSRYLITTPGPFAAHLLRFILRDTRFFSGCCGRIGPALRIGAFRCIPIVACPRRLPRCSTAVSDSPPSRRLG